MNLFPDIPEIVDCTNFYNKCTETQKARLIEILKKFDPSLTEIKYLKLNIEEDTWLISEFVDFEFFEVRGCDIFFKSYEIDMVN